MSNCSTVVSQHDRALSDSLDNSILPDGALSVVPLFPGFADPLADTLIHAHISPRGVQVSSKSSGAVGAGVRTFDNSTVERLSSLVDLRKLPQASASSPVPKPSSKTKQAAPLPERQVVLGDVAYLESVKPVKSGKVEIWLDGSLIKVGKPLGAGGRSGGGKRNIIIGFSKASRRRLLQKLAKVRQDAKPYFITLTYPGEFSLEPADWKRDFDKWCKRLHRKYPDAAVVWRLEPQRRGAPHYHCLVYNLPVLSDEIRQWISSSWYMCVGSGDARHLRYGTDVRVCNNPKMVRSYLGKYIAKTQAAPVRCDDDGVIDPAVDWSTVGRWWGVRYGDSLPWSKMIASDGWNMQQSSRLIRYIRRYLKGQGVKVNTQMPSITAFVNNPVHWFANLYHLVNGGSNESLRDDYAREFWHRGRR